MLHMAREMGLRAQTEIHALFRHTVPPDRRENLNKQVRGIIPDLMMALPVDGRGTVTEETFIEVKTVTFTQNYLIYELHTGGRVRTRRGGI